MYVIKRTDQGGGYVSRPGCKRSYTHSINHVRLFRTREQAEADRCLGNEITLDMEALKVHRERWRTYESDME